MGHYNWETGKHVRLHTGEEVTIENNGDYISGGSHGLWMYLVKKSDGKTIAYIPCVGDVVLKDPEC